MMVSLMRIAKWEKAPHFVFICQAKQLLHKHAGRNHLLMISEARKQSFLLKTMPHYEMSLERLWNHLATTSLPPVPDRRQYNCSRQIKKRFERHLVVRH